MKRGIEQELRDLASTDLFATARDRETFIGRPFYIDYTHLKLLVNDKWKHRVGGLPAGAFLLCAHEGDPQSDEIVLLRVLGPTALPTDSDVVASMVEYYKEGAPESKPSASQLDTFTRYEFMFSGVHCRVLGTFYRGSDGKTCFGADIENFYSAHNYSVYKPCGRVLEYIVNFSESGGIPGGNDQVRIGEVRYSAARHQVVPEAVPIYVSALDFVGKRTALFGMTRTGKSNTVKKLIQAVMDLSTKRVALGNEALLPVGQIIFDINGEYANINQQDAGTAIFELYKEKTTRYSLQEKPDFEVMKLNFHREIEAGLSLIRGSLSEGASDYVNSFLSISFEPPDPNEQGEIIRHGRLVAAYRACLHAAGIKDPSPISFTGEAHCNGLSGIAKDPKHGLTGDEAVQWFTNLWENYDSDFFADYRRKKGKEWASEDLKSVLVMLTRKRSPGGKGATISGFRKLEPLRDRHSSKNTTSFEQAIVEKLRRGELVIIDLSQGDPILQRIYSERICNKIFNNAMRRFIANERPNYIQFYFEEAHNLFPKKEDKDLTQIYNRLAKEGAKLRIGLVYATQEVSSISANVLKNTQNWFVSHLNNSDELREIDKYYDFADFVDSLRRAPDRGFIRMKTYSNAFVVPVQIDRFAAKDSNQT